jgi:hypothetical protein
MRTVAKQVWVLGGPIAVSRAVLPVLPETVAETAMRVNLAIQAITIIITITITTTATMEWLVHQGPVLQS